MQKEEILNFITEMGELLLENGAETYRVEDTIIRIFSALNVSDCDVFATSTGLFVSIDKHTKIKRIEKRTMNLDRICKLNEISRKIVSNDLSIDEAKNMLSEIKVSSGYSMPILSLSSGVTCCFFSLLFKGSLYDAISAFIVGLLWCIFDVYIGKKNIPNFLQLCFGGIFIALLSLIFLNFGLGKDVDNIIISAVMPLVPGVCFTNAIRDIFKGDYISGGSRIFEAIFIGVSISVGVGFVLMFWINIFGSFLI